MSPLSFSMLSGAGLIKGRDADANEGLDANKIYVHTNYDMVAEKSGNAIVARLTDEDRNGARIVVTQEAPVYPVTLDSAGAQANYLSAVTEAQVKYEKEDGTLAEVPTEAGEDGVYVDTDGTIYADGYTVVFELATDTPGDDRQDQVNVGDTIRIDCYELHTEGAYEMQIDAETFAGYYYIEASTLFRDESTGNDLPAEFVIPRGKIQSNFTFTMANSGDPSEQMFQSEYWMAA